MRTRRRPTTDRPDRQRGAVMVEMALLLPLLLVLIIGMVEFGRVYNARITLTHATREGVREFAITQDGGEGEDRAIAAAVSLSGVSASASAATCTPGEDASITTNLEFPISIPFLPLGPIQLTSTAVMRCGG